MSGKVTDDFTVLVGDARQRLADLPDRSVQTCVTSPPYYGLRDYGVDGQLGAEDTPEEYVANLVDILDGVHRVLRDDGTLWLNLGDTYAGTGYGKGTGNFANKNNPATMIKKKITPNCKPKDLIGVPWMVAFALRERGWWLRSDIIWHKPNPMPESTSDRPTNSHEYIFLLSKSKRYHYDQHAIKEPAVKDPMPMQADPDTVRRKSKGPHSRGEEGFNHQYADDSRLWAPDGKRNKRSVWTVTTKPFPEAHFAVYPPELIVPCIKAGTSEAGACTECGTPYERIVEQRNPDDTGASTGGAPGREDGGYRERDHTGEGGNQLATRNIGTDRFVAQCDCDGETEPCLVMDPFCGAGTTGVVCTDLGRRFVGIELNPDYAEMATERIMGTNLTLFK